MATVARSREPAIAEGEKRPESLADLPRRLGNIPASRVRLHPPPGMATQADALRIDEDPFRTAICERVDGTLVEKPVGEDFAAGTRLAWVADPKTQTVRAHRSPEEFVVLGIGDVLDGGPVLPDLRIPVGDLFDLGDA